MATIRKKWTGRESHALREAMRLSQRDFANELGISAKSISNWESGGAEFVPRHESQAILDTKLRQVSDEVRARFELILAIVPTEDDAELKTGREVTGATIPAVTSVALESTLARANSAFVDEPTPSAIPPDLPDVPISVLVQASTADAAKITVSAGREIIDSLAIEQFFEEVRRLAVLYNSSTAGIDHLVLERSTELRRILQELATAYRDPSQAADLYLMIGLLSAICSQACLDLGYPEAAMTQARASFIMGDLIGHDGLRAWILGTRSLIARFQGRYDEALSYARRGLQYATSGTALVRLRCGEGQTLAHMGDATNAIDALNLAKDAREHVNSTDVVDGLFTFSEAKQTYYSGSSLQWLPGSKNAKAAETESMRAIRMFRESSPGNHSGDELLAHVYLGNSRLTLGEVEGSIEALRPVLDLPVPERNAWERKRMREIASRLSNASFSDSRFSISAREEISSFTEPPAINDHRF